jgi:hypothetical protein
MLNDALSTISNGTLIMKYEVRKVLKEAVVVYLKY